LPEFPEKQARKSEKRIFEFPAAGNRVYKGIYRRKFMEYRTLGKTGEKVSILGFGCMRFPLIGGEASRIDEDTAGRMLRRAIDRGVNYLDTAWPYHGTGLQSPGESEPFLGRFLQDGYREKVKLATKLPCWVVESREDMDRILSDQLERLQTGYIDFYLLHSLNRGTWERMKELGVFDFLDAALADGRIGHAGFSFHDEAPLFREIVDAYDWSFCQIQYNYLDTEYQAGRAGLEYASSRGLGIVIMEPLRGGNLISGLPEAAETLLDGAGRKRSRAEWALRWLWNHPGTGVVLSGMSAMDQVEENVSLAETEPSEALDPAEMVLLDRVKTLYDGTVRVGCTGCAYCMPCPAGVNIPKVFTNYNNYFLFDNDGNRGGARFQYGFLLTDREKGSSCTECGLCEKHCPQNLSIREHLKEAHRLLSQE